MLNSTSMLLVDRFTIGYSTALEADIAKFSTTTKWFEAQLKGVAEYSETVNIPDWIPHLRDTPAAAWKNSSTGKRDAWQYGVDFSYYTLTQRILARNQLKEAMADFGRTCCTSPPVRTRHFRTVSRSTRKPSGRTLSAPTNHLYVPQSSTRPCRDFGPTIATRKLTSTRTSAASYSNCTPLAEERNTPRKT